VAAAHVVEREVAAEAGLRLADGRVDVLVDSFTHNRASEPVDENVVAPAALAIHADADAVRREHAREDGARELAALIRVQNRPGIRSAQSPPPRLRCRSGCPSSSTPASSAPFDSPSPR